MTCELKVRKWAKENGIEIPEQVIAEFTKILDSKRADLLTSAEFTKAVEKVAAVHIAQYRLAERVNSMREIITRTKALNAIQSVERSKPNSLAEALRSFLEGVSLGKGFDGSNRDVKVMQSVHMSNLLSVWKNSIGNLGEVLKAGKLDREIMIELHAIRNKLPLGSTNSEMALKAAQAIDTVQKSIFELKKNVNAFMSENSDYIMQRVHSQEKISATRKEAWVADAMKVYGEKSFQDALPGEKKAIFESIYDDIVNGTYSMPERDIEAGKYLNAPAMGRGDILERMAQARKLVASSPELEFAYNQKYGHGTVHQTVYMGMLQAAKDVSRIEKFSASPKRMYEDLYTRVYNGASKAERMELERMKPKLDISYRTAMGSSDSPARTTQARWLNSIKAIASMASLGKVILRLPVDISVSALMVRSLTGKSVIGAGLEIAGQYAKFLSPLSKEARANALENLWMLSKVGHGAFLDELGGNSALTGIHGNLAKMAEGFGKINGMALHDQSIRAALGTVMARELGRASETGFEKLPQYFQDGLRKYGIHQAEWELIQQAGTDLGKGPAGSSLRVIDQDAIENLSDDAIKGYLGKKYEGSGEFNATQISNARRELSNSLGILINDHANYGSTSPSTRQKAFMYRGHDVNDKEGIALRALTLFRGSALTTADAYRRAFASGVGGARGDIAGVTQAAIMGVSLWTMGRYAESLIEGQEPPGLTPGFLVEAAVGSGSLGLTGDLFLGEMGRSQSGYQLGANVALNALGPIAGRAGRLLEFGYKAGRAGYDQMVEPEGRRAASFPAKEGIKFATDLIPGRNLIGIKNVLDTYMINSAIESVSSGYLNNLERNFRKQKGLWNDHREYLFNAPTDSTFFGQ